MSAKPKKRIAIVDCGKPAYVANGILRILAKQYDFEITEDYGADYIFHSCMGYEVLKYSGIRIFVCGECVSPNFNISDYALTFDQIDFGDRYHWFPLIKLYETAYASFARPRLPAETIMAQKRDFCAYVMSNTSNSAPERTEIFEKLSEYKTVHSGGRWRNNTGIPIYAQICHRVRKSILPRLFN
jgi:alpha(1,3/1,4) fucosyltransferase